jgi:hypothetical protein
MDTELRSAILELVEHGSMAPETIIDELAEQFENREIKLELVDMVSDGEIEEHPEIDDVYRTPE